jgi:hypothetical protein
MGMGQKVNPHGSRTGVFVNWEVDPKFMRIHQAFLAKIIKSQRPYKMSRSDGISSCNPKMLRHLPPWQKRNTR